MRLLPHATDHVLLNLLGRLLANVIFEAGENSQGGAGGCGGRDVDDAVLGDGLRVDEEGLIDKDERDHLGAEFDDCMCVCC